MLKTEDRAIIVPDAPDIPGLTFRHFRGEEDYPHMAAVLEGCKDKDEEERVVSVEDIARSYSNLKNCEPYQDMIFLEIDGNPIAAVMCFNYQSTVYLYNNGYDRRYRSLSAGLLCKLLSIKESIQSGKKTYDLLKGSEPYKHRLGGKPIPLYRCDIGI